MNTRPLASSKNVVTAPNITVGDYTYYDDAVDPTGFERNNVLFNYPVAMVRLHYTWNNLWTLSAG